MTSKNSTYISLNVRDLIIKYAQIHLKEESSTYQRHDVLLGSDGLLYVVVRVNEEDQTALLFSDKYKLTTEKFTDLQKDYGRIKEIHFNETKKAAKKVQELEGKSLNVSNKRLRDLRKLKEGYETIDCSNNNLTELPTLPRTLVKLNCRLNLLTSLPELPIKLEELICDNNPFPVKEKRRIKALCKRRGIKLKI